MPSAPDYYDALPGWKKHLLDNPSLFILKYFPHKISALEEFHLRLIDTATTQPRSLILYPATHGKTTLVSTCLPIWAVCKDPNIRLGLILKNEFDANNVGQSLQAELIANEELIRDFGPFEPVGEDEKPFAILRMSIAKRTRRTKEPTIALFGAGSRTALGHRTDWTICDDIITDLNSATPERREKVREWFMQGPATMGEYSDSRLTVVGTLFDPDDLYHELADLVDADTGEPIYTVQREDAIVEMCVCGHEVTGHRWDKQRQLYSGECETGGCDCDLTVIDPQARRTLWPRKWNWLRLMQRKAEMGTLDFNKRFRNIAVDKSRMVFREEYVKGGYIGKQKYPGCLDKNYRVGEVETSWRRAAGFDPAIGKTKSRKFCAHLVLATGSCILHERCFWVVDLEREQMTLPQQVALIINRHQHYDLQTSMIEANSYQAGLCDAVQEKMSEQGLALKVEPHYTSRTNKPDPEIGVGAMSPWFENGQVHIPWGDVHSQRKMAQLIEELVMYPGRTTDTVMAFWFAWKALQETAPRYLSFNRLVQQRSVYAGVASRRKLKNPAYS